MTPLDAQKSTRVAAREARWGSRDGERTQRRAGWLQRWLEHLLVRVGAPRVQVQLWDGSVIGPDPAVARVRISSRTALLRLLFDPDVGFGDGYRAGDVGVDPLEPFLEEVFVRMPPAPRRRRRKLLARQSPDGARTSIHQHYDLGNEFYALWLDDGMNYSGAYFPEPGLTLADGQRAKLEHICRKLRLQPGQRVIEIGCGWGTLALFMAERYGVHVRAFNISRAQLEFARRRAAQAAVAGRVEFIEQDYRDIAGQADAVVSVGMLEHVGVENYAAFGAVLDRCLTAEGRGLIQTIGYHTPLQFDRWIEARIFPGAEPPSLGELMRIFEPFDFAVLDVENLRRHYAETLEHWLARFEAQADKVEALYDAAFVRTWRLYLAGSLAAFRTGTHQLYQVLFQRRASRDLPRSRRHVEM